MPVPVPVYVDACQALTAAANSEWGRAEQYWLDMEDQQESNLTAMGNLYQMLSDTYAIAMDVDNGTSTTADLAAYNIDLAGVSQFTAGC
jgi:hypothetical protein